MSISVTRSSFELFLKCRKRRTHSRTSVVVHKASRFTIKCWSGRRVLRYKTSPDNIDVDSSLSLRERISSRSASCWGERDLNSLYKSKVSSLWSLSLLSYNEAVWHRINIVRKTGIKNSFYLLYIFIVLTKQCYFLQHDLNPRRVDLMQGRYIYNERKKRVGICLFILIWIYQRSKFSCSLAFDCIFFPSDSSLTYAVDG